jgi:dienelactone hydrolase
VRYLDGEPAPELTAPVDLLSRDYRNEVPVSDEVYEVYRRQLAYIPGELNAQVESMDDSQEDWTREHVTLDAGYADERFSVYVFLPTSVSPPYTPLVFFFGLGPFASQLAESSSEIIRPGGTLADMLRAGRAIVVPVWNGSFERWDDFLAQTGEQYMRSFSARMGEWAEDLGRTIDYLETRSDMDAGNIGYLGVSFGSSTPLALLALEERLRAALLMLPGYTYREVPPEIDAVNFVPRITMPVLMIGGRYDYVFPVETAQEPLYDHLGTPEADKQHLIYEMGHGNPYPRQMWRDVLPWLDEYLGPVG